MKEKKAAVYHQDDLFTGNLFFSRVHGIAVRVQQCRQYNSSQYIMVVAANPTFERVLRLASVGSARHGSFYFLPPAAAADDVEMCTTDIISCADA